MPWPEEGGKPPTKIKEKIVVVKQAPSHDGTPCFTAYSKEEGEDEEGSHPRFCLRIYDTTPDASSNERIRDLALKIHKGTEKQRCEGLAGSDPDRIEVQGFPLARDVTDEQRIEACKKHHMAEIAARNLEGGSGIEFYIPATFDSEGHWRDVIIIDRLEKDWEDAALNRGDEVRGGKTPPGERKTDPHGGFLYVAWDLTELARREYEDDPLPETVVRPLPIYKLGEALSWMREHMAEFRCFVRDGGLARERGKK